MSVCVPEGDILELWTELEVAVVEPVLSTELPAFGAEMRRRHFPRLGRSQLGMGCAHYLNQGGTGALMEPVLRAKELVARITEEQPMSYHREIAPVLMRRARAMTAAYLGAPPEALSFTASASSGFYAVLRSMSLAPGDIIITSSLQYHSFEDDLHRYCKSRSVRICTVSLPLPITSSGQIVRAFETVLAGIKAAGLIARVRLAFFDHVSSKPAVLFPVSDLCALFRGAFTTVCPCSSCCCGHYGLAH